MQKKTIGIIGGMGPLSSIKFYNDAISYCQDILKLHNNDEYPHLLISNLPVPDLISSTESEHITRKMIIEELQRFEKAGATLFAIACNTVHLYIDEFRKSISHPLLSIVEESAKSLSETNGKTTLLLATPTTIKKNLYQPALKRIGKIVQIPSDEDLALFRTLIPHLVGKTQSQDEVRKLNALIGRFEKNGTDEVLLACTELSFGIDFSAHKIPMYDTITILAESAMRQGLSQTD